MYRPREWSKPIFLHVADPFALDEANTTVVGGEISDDGGRIVRRTVIYDDEFPIIVCLAQNTVYHFGQQRSVVVTGNDDGKLRYCHCGVLLLFVGEG